MTPNPIIVSIPHTGTRFLKDRLGIADHIHTHTNWVTLMQRINGRELVVPLRSPKDVFRSWCRRNEEYTLKNWLGGFFLAWGVMHTLDQMYDIDFICVDKQEDPRIKDWAQVGNQDQDHVRWKLHDIDLRQIYKLPFVNRYYHSWAK